MIFIWSARWKNMRPLASALVAVVFLLSGQIINGRTAPSTQGGTYPTGQNSAPGSVVRFEHLTIQDGLSQNAGLTIFQDSRGFLWFGTQDGLNRYDGYSFTVFRHDDEDPTTISHNSILSITEDEDSFLWVGTWGGGLNRFDPVSETFTSYQNDPQDPASLSNNIVTSILQDADGNVWVGTLGGLDRYDTDTDGFEHFRYVYGDPTSLSSNVISVIFEDSRRQLWVGTGALGSPGTGLNRFNPSTGRAMRFQHNDLDPTSLASDNISAVYEASDGNFWIGTGGYGLTGEGLELFNPRTGTAFHYPYDSRITDSISGNNISAIWGDSTGLWVGTRSNGLNRMDFSNVGHFVRYQHDLYFPDSLGDDEVWSLFKDHSGILWIGTADQGISKLPANTGQFSLYRNNPSRPSSLGTNIVGAFSEDKYGYIWIGTWGGGLDRFDPRHGDFEHFRNDPADPASLSSDMVMTVYADPQNVVWVGTLGGGLNRMDLATGQITHYVHNPRDPASLPNDNVAVIIPDGEGGLWLGTYGGLAHYNPETDSFTNYINTQPGNPDNLARLSENRVVSLYLDNAKGLLWIGTWGGGLNRLDLKSPLHTLPRFALFKTYRYNSNDPASLSEDSVWAIQKTADGYLWLGTQSGLNRFNPVTQTFERYSQKQGLPNDSVVGILRDEQGYLWLTTANGLAKFDRRQETFTNYDVTDGLQSNVFNSNAYFRSVNGTMYIGGVNGFNTFIPSKVQPNPVHPKVAVTRFEVFNEPATLDLTGKTPIKLSYQQNFITFEFAALDFSAPQQNRYAYMLEGFDQNWIQTEDRRFATYTNLPGGQYVFRVKASNSDGIWNEDGIAIPVIVSPPFWQAIWFQGSAVLLLIGLLVFGVRWRLRTISIQKTALENQVAIRTSELRYEIEQREKAEQALAEKAAQDAVAEDRTRLARDLHDAVTQTLFSASMIAEVLPEIWSGNQAEGRKRLDELRQLTRGALAEMRTLLVELRPSGLTDIPLPELLRQLCDSLVGRARLPIQLHTDRIPKLPPELQVCLYRITQEALNNIIKHARATQVLVTLRADDKVTLSIIDNGCGFDPASITPEHLGLKIMCERAEALGAEFSVYSEPGEGTQIVVSWVPTIPARLIRSDNQQISPERDDELSGMEIEN